MFTCYNWPLLAVVDCGNLTNPMNGMVTLTTTTFESTATYSCNMNYVLSGAMTRMCRADGTWSGSDPNCIGEELPGLYTLTMYMVGSC